MGSEFPWLVEVIWLFLLGGYLWAMTLHRTVIKGYQLRYQRYVRLNPESNLQPDIVIISF